MQRLPTSMIRHPGKNVCVTLPSLQTLHARTHLPSLKVTASPTLNLKSPPASPPIRAFHSSRDFADYMKQVMSPMTGREGEQTPSEESNTLREIDRLFSIISSE